MEAKQNTFNEEMCRWVFENSDFGIIITDPDLRIVAVNKWLELKVLSKDSNLTGQSILDVFPEIRVRNLEHYLKDALSGASVMLSSRFHDYFIELPHGFENVNEHMHQTVQITPVIDNGTPTGLIIHIEDVTERVIREELMQRKNEELQKLNSTKDKFFRIIAHDLRSPFTALIGFSEMLTENDNLSNEQTRQIIATLNTTIKDQYAFLDNLLKWSQLQIGKFEQDVDYRYVSFLEVMNHVLSLAAPLIQSKSIEVRTSIPEDFSFITDYQSITTILYNLFFNALKFTKPGGSVSIEVVSDESETIISVTDTGVGIAEDRLDRLFRIGEAISTPGTNHEKGSGLGLILVKEFVEKLQGRIWVRSVVGEGSTFSVSLPVINF